MTQKFKMYALLSVIAGLVMVTGMSGCKEDACKGVTCQNGGTCNNGDCACTFAYEGSNCATLKRTKFLATYEGNVIVGSFPAAPTTIVVTEGPDSLSQLTMTISNAAINGEGKAIAIGGNALVIPSQSIGGFQISGTGSISSDGAVMYDTLNITGLGTGYFEGIRQ